MHLKGEIENDSFVVKQKLTHYAIGEDLHVYNLRAVASKTGGNVEEIVKDDYGLCFTDELHDINWFTKFKTKSLGIYVMKQTFIKAYSRLNMSFPNFRDVFNEYIIDYKNMFETLEHNHGDIKNFIIVECDFEHEKCRFYKEHCGIEEKWMPHLEPFNHKSKMTTSENYDIDALYKYLMSRKDVTIPNGIEEVHDIFDNKTIRVLNFYVQIFTPKEAEREIYEDLPKETIDITAYRMKV